MNTYLSWGIFILVCLIAVDVLVRILIYIDRKNESEFLLYCRQWLAKVRPELETRSLMYRLIEYAAALERKIK